MHRYSRRIGLDRSLLLQKVRVSDDARCFGHGDLSFLKSRPTELRVKVFDAPSTTLTALRSKKAAILNKLPVRRWQSTQ
jgi:hypothetical protein